MSNEKTHRTIGFQWFRKLGCWFSALLIAISPLFTSPLQYLVTQVGCRESSVYLTCCHPVAGIHPALIIHGLEGFWAWGASYTIPLGVLLFVLCGFVPWRHCKTDPSACFYEDVEAQPTKVNPRNIVMAIGVIMVAFVVLLSLSEANDRRLKWESANSEWDSSAKCKLLEEAAKEKNANAEMLGRYANENPSGATYWPIALDHHSGRLWIALGDVSGTNFNRLFYLEISSGNITPVPIIELDLNYEIPPSRVATPFGLLLIGNKSLNAGAGDPLQVVAITPDKGNITSQLKVMRKNADSVDLPDGSTLLIGGVTTQKDNNEDESHSSAVEQVALRGDDLVITRLADIPGEPRQGVVFVVIDADSIMAIGGVVTNKERTENPVKETYILSLSQNRWRPGPSLRTPRSDAAAALLPDGSVMVMGGWTLEDGGLGEKASRTTERWMANSDSFVLSELLPIGLAKQQTQWFRGDKGKQLLLTGGMIAESVANNEVLVYDEERSVWSSGGSSCRKRATGKMLTFAYTHNGESTLWCSRSTDEGITDISSFTTASSSTLHMVTPESGKYPEALDGSDMCIRRHEVAVLSPSEASPGYIVGGITPPINDCYNCNAQSAFAVRYWQDGSHQPIAALNYPRRSARIFSLPHDVIVVASNTPDRNNERNISLTMEVLIDSPSNDGHWTLLNDTFEGDTILGIADDGSLVAVASNGKVSRFFIQPGDDGQHSVVHIPMPSLKHARQGGSVGGLPDGRIFVSGGEIAININENGEDETLMQEGRGKDERYVELAPTSSCEIYSPETNRWKFVWPTDEDYTLCTE